MGLSANTKAYVSTPAQVTFALLTSSNQSAAVLLDEIDKLRWEIMALAMVTFMRLGQTAVGSRALAAPLIDLFTIGVDASLTGVAEVFNRFLIPRLLQANGSEFAGVSDYPTLSHTKISQPHASAIPYLGAVQTFMGGAARPDKVWVREILGMPTMEEIEEDELLNPPKPEPEPEQVPEEKTPSEEEPGAAAGPEEEPEEGPEGEDEEPGAAEQAAIPAWALRFSEPHQEWAARKRQQLMQAGFTAEAADLIVQTVLDTLPEGADPDTWLLPPTAQEKLTRVLDQPEVVEAAKGQWEKDAAPKYANILQPEQEG